MTDKPAHYCPDWDFAVIYPGDVEMEACLCKFEYKDNYSQGDTPYNIDGEGD